jgi:hypothetical protein
MLLAGRRGGRDLVDEQCSEEQQLLLLTDFSNAGYDSNILLGRRLNVRLLMRQDRKQNWLHDG